MKMLNFSDITRTRIAKWMMTAQPVEEGSTWIERRQAIDVGGHTYLITNGQVFQCAHCGHYDPEWNATEVLKYFEKTMGIVPYEIEIVCSLPVAREK